MDDSNDPYGEHPHRESQSNNKRESLDALKKNLSDMARQAYSGPESDARQPSPLYIMNTDPSKIAHEAVSSSYNSAAYPSYHNTSYPQPPVQNVAFPSAQISSQEKKNQTQHKKRMSAEEKQHLVLNYLNTYYQPCANSSGNVLLMERSSGTLFPPGVDEIRQAVNAACFHRVGVEVSNSAIRSALEKFTERASVPLSTRPVYGRAGCVERAPSFRVINCHQGAYRVDSMSPQVALSGASFDDVPYVIPHRSLPLEVINTHIQAVPQRLIPWLKGLTGLPETSLLLVITWMMLTWMPDKKQVLLELRGGDNDHIVQAQRVIKKLIDPSRQPGDNALPTGTAAFNAFCQQEYVISLERFDSLTPQQQKNLLGVMEGKEVEWVWRDSKKQKMRIHVQCPVMMSCLESPLTDTALMARTLSMDAGTGARGGFGLQATEMLSGTLTELLALFGLVQQSVHYLVPPEKAARYRRQGPLSDFCHIGEAVAVNLGQPEEAFWEQLQLAQRDGQEDAYESDDIAQALVQCWEDNANEAIEWSMTDWLELLPAYLQKGQEVGFPKTQKALSIRFKKASEVLKAHGLLLEPIGRIDSNRRAWRLRKMPDTSAFASL
ncbi:hypothetical protein ACIGG6_09155 [Vreelandella lionensis]|uniref:Uncharacterized protein n=1 Tax=Vreelandella lionensis TaxID=1144478 RepID=A0ABW8BU13_9GAMM